ncbi:cob(I)alamin adenosyltransferase [Mobilisporobacter senegalensis]|uniref:Cob(I)alamin adenosyltransferase n=1 Tax=Mobilisporobacter senegalensis TaxID=1329262 RepID=A0A3N1XYJ1_9FIRM|nr:cob(I)yrinic acid a,c-diamide adenosyltransferase [Mobilisporobacter senegalensis]ROR31639.1 cob(I)alamin adenosyltransferase [Mobilisporobacter senegalensis]
MKGLIHVYTGDGKGKSTSAIGLSIRCAGNGKKVIYTQFLKDNQSSELKIIKEIDNISFIPCVNNYGFYSQMTEDQKVKAKEMYTDLLEKVIEGAKTTDCQLLVLDEVILAYKFRLIDQNSFLHFLQTKPEGLEVVMTGRYAPDELIELADYVSEIKKIKHPYDNGILARDGIEL